MSLGIASSHTLTDIANAIRERNGKNNRIRPEHMAQEILDLGDPIDWPGMWYPYGSTEHGLMHSEIFSEIADAIREKAGTTKTYKPNEMAEAIRSMVLATPEPELKARALYTDAGTLEFTYLRSEDSQEGNNVVEVYDVSPTGYTSQAARGWNNVKTQIKRAVFHSSFKDLGLTNGDYWFYGFTNLEEVSGFENFSGLKTAAMIFSSCAKLHTIFATSYDSSKFESSSNPFYGCICLVGGTDMYMPTNTVDISKLKLGTGGVLTDPESDAREWFYSHLYDDGDLVLTVSSTPETGRTLKATGRICANAKYAGTGYQPWNSHKDTAKYVIIKSDMATLERMHLNYLFYAFTYIQSFEGLKYLPKVGEMRYTFSGLTRLLMLDLVGFDTSCLSNLYYTFGGCTALTTIYAHSTWSLPSTVTSYQTFYNCTSLRGGNNMAYGIAYTGHTYFRIDKPGQAGYLTGVG